MTISSITVLSANGIPVEVPVCDTPSGYVGKVTIDGEDFAVYVSAVRTSSTAITPAKARLQRVGSTSDPRTP